ncbi:MAG: hypothetical protein H6923_01165 [Alphaproteobacteria bacterium]|nr:hypothetical protein [Alphaproteobacteria bacterium]
MADETISTATMENGTAPCAGPIAAVLPLARGLVQARKDSSEGDKLAAYRTLRGAGVDMRPAAAWALIQYGRAMYQASKDDLDSKVAVLLIGAGRIAMGDEWVVDRWEDALARIRYIEVEIGETYAGAEEAEILNLAAFTIQRLLDGSPRGPEIAARHSRLARAHEAEDGNDG